ncbi:MAG: response regulator [Cyanothece sp. SIO1E1]|nr:response regulator [Cyanothece sp. SIO1E1]
MSNLAILCVDDQKEVLESLTEQLKRHLADACEIEAAESGEEALETFADLQAEGLEVALVITDHIMPGMKGDELLIQLHARYPKVLQVMLTGQASTRELGNVVNAANLYRYIAKPWDETDLILTAREALRSYVQDKQLAEQNEALQRLNAVLEGKVEARTAALSLANAKLQQSETQLRASLHEKELLLKEVHHRVKNNLQVISSLFSLQSRYVQEPKILALLAEGQNRIRAIALVHQKLYKSKDLSCIDFAEYLESFTSYLLTSYHTDPSRIQLKLNVKNVLLDLDTAILCGLLINELTSNALKHAFPAQQSGQIKIDFLVDSQGQLSLSIEDDGVGLPENLDIQQTNSLGLRLVRELTRQLKGQLQIGHDHGTCFRITLPQTNCVQKCTPTAR